MSSALAAASLILKPEGYSEGTLESLKPIDRSGDFTFTRGSNLSATRVNSAGLIEKGRENLFKYSNQFDNAIWQGYAVWSSGQVDKDGGTSAWTFAKNNASASDFYNDTTTNGVQTFSIYAKKQIGVGLKPYFFGSSNGYATFNLEDGSVYSTNGSIIIDTNVETYNSLWWRISVTINGSSGNWYLYVTDGTDTQTTDVITLQDAQLEAGMVATDYIETGASTVKAGILENTPRLDYSGGATEPSLLLEPSRTNLVRQSEYFNSTDHILNPNISVVNNNTESPEGVQNAAEITFDSSTNRGLSSITFGNYSSQTHSVSIYAKSSGGVQNVRLKLTAGGVADYYSSNFLLTDEWQRFTFSKTFGATATSNIQGGIVNGTGESVGTCYIYGLQLEANASYPTSYIPNHSGGSVTREVDDIARINNASTNGLLNNYNTTFLFEGSTFKKQQSSNTRFVTLLDAAIASNPRILLFTSNLTSTHSLLLQYRVSGETDVTLATGSTFSYGDNFKAAVTISGTSLSLFVDGVKIGEETIVQGDDIEVIDLAGLATDMSHNAKQFVIFPTALSDADCITLTTL